MITEFTIIRPPKVNADWSWRDYAGTIKVRLSFGRDGYKIAPGLYAFQNPDENSDVFVTANYKLSFDILRRKLNGLNAWILVLDTKGINVWCAAGKGTFGTNEVVRQINQTNLKEVVKHRRIILPQLGAPGVNAHEIKSATGFNAKFGPVRASDIKDYLNAGYKKNEEMRRVKFNVIDRLMVLPVEFILGLTKFILLSILLFVISGLSINGYSWHMSADLGLNALIIVSLAYLAGTVFTPLLLPWVPFRSFAAKGLIVGLLITTPIFLFSNISTPYISTFTVFLIGIALSSFLAMNFTGASTYTSLSGVRKEMRRFVPIQIVIASIGFIGFIVSRFINF